MIEFDPKYKNGDLKEFEHWKLVVSFLQHTLGSFMIFSKREVEKFSDLTVEELVELTKVMKIMENALEKTFKPDRFNYCQLGNVFHNLHFHGIPRYASPRTFDGKEFIDVKFGVSVDLSYSESSPEYILKMRDYILPHL